MGIIERYLEENQTTTAFWITYSNILTEKISTGILNAKFNLADEYAKFYNNFVKLAENKFRLEIAKEKYIKLYDDVLEISNDTSKFKTKLKNTTDKHINLYEAFKNDYTESSIDSKVERKISEYVFKINSFNAQLGRWNALADEEIFFSLPPNNELYVILVAFILNLNEDETNQLLSAAGLEELHGRDPLYCAYIYSLNNDIPYDECVFNIYPKIQKQIGEVQNNFDYFHIDSVDSLKQYVEENQPQNNQTKTKKTQKITEKMTAEVIDIKSEKKLNAYIEKHAKDFITYRESPRKYLCRYLLNYIEEYIDQDHKILPTDTIFGEHKSEFTELIASISTEFEIFYFSITRINIHDKIDFFSYLSDDELEDKLRDLKRGELSNKLLQYVQGKRKIKRNFLLLFLYFLGERDCQRLEAICIKCDFGLIDVDYSSLFNLILCELLDETVAELSSNPNEIKNFLIIKFSELKLVKLYCDLTYFKKDVKEEENINEDLYSDIVNLMLEELNSIEEINNESNLSAKTFLLVFDYLSTINNYYESDITRNYLLEVLNILNKPNFSENEIRLSFSEFSENLANLNSKPVDTARQNYDYTKYLQNPLFLDPRIDL